MQSELLRKPSWLKVRAPGGPEYARIKETLRDRKLFTVCEEARCPNVAECWSSGTATFMLLGDTCTRRCSFCSVKTGNPLGWTDPDEPQKIAESVALMKLKYVVLTTVDRDDLKDGGASHIAQCLTAIRKSSETPPMIEFLTGDFRGVKDSLHILCAAEPDVFAHNVETVPRLTPTVRDRRASFKQSLEVLHFAHEQGLLTKSSIMLGMGETFEEVRETLRELRAVGVSIITLGQYLQPTKQHLSVERYVSPEEFEDLKQEALALGFEYAAAGPLVRSSYKAAENYIMSRSTRSLS